jgi:hypothetical protein
MRAAREIPLPGKKRGYRPSGLENLRPAPERLEA